MDKADEFKYGAVMGLLRTHRALQYDLKRFRACMPDENENELWKQCEARLLEIEEYEEMISDEAASLVMMHILSQKEVTLLLGA